MRAEEKPETGNLKPEGKEWNLKLEISDPIWPMEASTPSGAWQFQVSGFKFQVLVEEALPPHKLCRLQLLAFEPLRTP
jgi:hypothetical protein